MPQIVFFWLQMADGYVRQLMHGPDSFSDYYRDEHDWSGSDCSGQCAVFHGSDSNRDPDYDIDIVVPVVPDFEAALKIQRVKCNVMN